MANVVFDPEHKNVLDALLLHLPGVTAGNMFRYPAYCVHRKLFACLYGDRVGIKVPEEIANSLLSKAYIVPFQPTGKPKMREWVICGTKRIWSYYLPWRTGRTLGLCRSFRHKAQSHSILSTPRPRLGVAPLRSCPEPLRGQTSLPLLTHRKGQAAPTVFLLTDPTARRGGRPYPGSQHVSRG